MDIQRTILWVIFGMSLLLLWDRWQVHQGRPSLMAPPPAGAPAASGAAPGTAPATPGGSPAAADASVPQGSAPGPASAAAAPSDAAAAAASGPAAALASAVGERVIVRSDLLRLDIDPQGASVVRAELRGHEVEPDWTTVGLAGLVTGRRARAHQPVVLLDVQGERTYTAQSGLYGAAGGAGGYPNHRSAWELLDGTARERSLEAGADALTVRFAAEGGGLRVVKSYTLHRGRYDIDVRHEITNLGSEPVSPGLYLQLVRDGSAAGGPAGVSATFTGPAVYTEAGKFQKLGFEDIAAGKASYERRASEGWIAMIQHYFVSAWVPPAGSAREYEALELERGGALYAVRAKLGAGPVAPAATASVDSKLFVGPQDQQALEQIAPGLELVVDYGWLTFLAKPLFWLLAFLHGLVANWGWAIVLLTVLVKLALYPLSAAGYKSMAKMKELAPRLQKIKEQYGEDRAKFQQAMMELYQREKINPLNMGGCLPILMQMPVFIALYWVLLASVELRNQPWMLWVRDLATPDPYFVLPLVMMGTMWIQYKLNPKPPDPLQAKMMAIMPFAFGIMFFLFPAGLVLYWVVNNVLSIAQQWYVTRQIEHAKAGRAG